MLFRLFRGGVALAASLALILPPRAGLAAEQVQAAVDRLNVRTGPGLDHSVITTLSINTTLTVLSRQGEWIQVKLPSGQEGWVAGWLVQSKGTAAAPSPPAAGPASLIKSKVTNLNVRSGPGLDAQVIGQLQPGPTYPLVQKQGDWAQIRLADNQTGWVALWLVEEVAAAPAPPDSSSADPAPPASGDTLTLVEAAVVYLEPTEASPAIGQLSAGDTVAIRGRSGIWAQITYEGQQGWIRTAAPPVQQTPSNGNTPSPAPDPLPAPAQPAPDPLPVPAQPAPAQPVPGSKGTITVAVPAVNLRSEPSIESRLLGTAIQGTVLSVLSTHADWYQVQTPDGVIGWVAGWLVSKAVQNAPAPQQQAMVTIREPDTNIRSGPSTRTAVIRRAQAGERFALLNPEGDWYRIRLPDGTIGYVAGWLVDAEGVDDVEVVVRGDELKGKIIVVDPGHGGSDAGASGRSFSTAEKTVNLQVSLALKRKLEAAGAQVIMTRSDDSRLSLQERVDIAVRNNADLFVSIHHNTHPDPTTNGSIVFYYDQERDGKLASLVQRELVKATNYRDLNSRFGDYYVLRENKIPAILAEIGFLSNSEEELKLRSEQQQELAAEGIFKGIVRYYQSGN